MSRVELGPGNGPDLCLSMSVCAPQKFPEGLSPQGSFTEIP